MMHIGDHRFKEGIDKRGEDAAEFMSKVTEVFCKIKVNFFYLV